MNYSTNGRHDPDQTLFSLAQFLEHADTSTLEAAFLASEWPSRCETLLHDPISRHQLSVLLREAGIAPGVIVPFALTPAHTAQLRASCISDAVSDARGYTSLGAVDGLRFLKTHGFSPQQARGAPGLFIPLFGADGKAITRHDALSGDAFPLGIFRPDTPSVSSQGKLRKYEFPQSILAALDCHPSCAPLLGDPSVPLWITEGVKKGDALASAGQCALAVLGVWNWRGTNAAGGTTVLPDWEYVALKGRQVRVVFDSDVGTNPQVEKALERLVGFLEARHARVQVVYLPIPPSGAKMGIDDFFAQGGTVEAAMRFLSAPGRLPALQGHGVAAQDLLTDRTNALAYMATHGTHTRYVAAWKAWAIWNGTAWERDDTFVVEQRMVEVVEALLSPDASRERVAHVRKSLSYDRVRAALHCVRSLPGMTCAPGVFDTHAFLVTCPNGIVDLCTGTLHPHDPALFMTMSVPVAYDPRATCPLFHEFLATIMHQDREVIEYLQRVFGYCLTGDTSAEVFWLFHGEGQNGKSTLFRVLYALFGALAKSTDAGTFIARETERISNDIARLSLARLVGCSELPEGKVMNEELVKRATGRDPLTARFLFGEFFDFVPQFKLIMTCNELPRVKGTGKAIWRRIHRVPFDVTIEDDARDLHLSDKLIAELPGIFAWVVEGARLYHQAGLCPPAAILMAVQGYAEEQDVIGRFLVESTEVAPDVLTPARTLYAAYARWCDASRERPVTETAFGRVLGRKGWTEDDGRKKRMTTGNVYIGIRLKESFMV